MVFCQSTACRSSNIGPAFAYQKLQKKKKSVYPSTDDRRAPYVFESGPGTALVYKPTGRTGSEPIAANQDAHIWFWNRVVSSGYQQHTQRIVALPSRVSHSALCPPCSLAASLYAPIHLLPCGPGKGMLVLQKVGRLTLRAQARPHA